MSTFDDYTKALALNINAALQDVKGGAPRDALLAARDNLQGLLKAERAEDTAASREVAVLRQQLAELGRINGQLGTMLADQSRLYALLERIAGAQEKQAELAQWSHDLVTDPQKLGEHIAAQFAAADKVKP